MASLLPLITTSCRILLLILANIGRTVEVYFIEQIDMPHQHSAQLPPAGPFVGVMLNDDVIMFL